MIFIVLIGKMICYFRFRRFEIELRIGLGYCDRIKGWVRKLLYLESMSLIKVLGLVLGYESGELVYLYFFLVEA